MLISTRPVYCFLRFLQFHVTLLKTMPKRKSTDELNGVENGVKKAATNEAMLKEDTSVETSNGSGEVINDGSTDVNRLSADGRSPTIKICSWNVAGLRAWVKKDGLKYLKTEDPDIICLQETKVLEKEIPGEVNSFKRGGKVVGSNDEGYYMYWLAAEQKGYSGVSLWSKEKPLKVSYGMGIAKHDKEGRLITAEYEKFYVITSYVPNSGKKLVNLDYRRTWNTDLKNYLNGLNEKKPIIFCGDLNVAHNEIDLKNPKTNTKNAGFTKEEREDFTSLLADGYIDTFRHLYPDKTGAYSFWTYMMNARSKNVGWRLDYYVIPKSLESSLCNSIIKSDVFGSDHCPILLTMAL